MWVATQDLPRSAAHPFYARLNQILEQHGSGLACRSARIAFSVGALKSNSPLVLQQFQNPVQEAFEVSVFDTQDVWIGVLKWLHHYKLVPEGNGHTVAAGPLNIAAEINFDEGSECVSVRSVDSRHEPDRIRIAPDLTKSEVTVHKTLGCITARVGMPNGFRMITNRTS
jgi:hypothetical protein